MSTEIKSEKTWDYTAIKMDKPLYKMARRKARKLRQTYSGYVRQLILDDLAATKAAK